MIGIHNSPGTFSDRWLETCRQRSLPFKLVDCLASDVIQQCSGLSAVLWHWSHNQISELLVARQVLTALRAKGLLVFPTVESSWHYDDKIAQKYLLEAIGAPLIPTWLFLDPQQAQNWIARATWPKVFKLRCGAGSNNVSLVNSRHQAQALCAKAFGPGFATQPGYLHDLKRRSLNAKNWTARLQKLRRAPRSFLEVWQRRRTLPRQRSYVYFQEFLPGNDFDTRITVIGNRAFGFRRLNRAGDFRASGSGRLLLSPDAVDPRAVQIAFAVAQRLASRSMAFDFLQDPEGKPRITEISYCYVATAVHECPGHWDPQLNWHPGQVWPQDAILDDVLHDLANTQPQTAPGDAPKPGSAHLQSLPL
jgi:hypothetical protein